MNLDFEQRRACVSATDNLSIRRQCNLLSVPRSTFYYKPCGETPHNLLYMRLKDEQYLKTPFYGSPRMCQHLQGTGHVVNEKRVAGLMKLMAIYPKKNLSKAA